MKLVETSSSEIQKEKEISGRLAKVDLKVTENVKSKRLIIYDVSAEMTSDEIRNAH